MGKRRMVWLNFKNLDRRQNALFDKLSAAAEELLGSGQFIQGEPVRKLEEELARFVQCSHCVSCANGTDALVLALKAIGLQENGAVFVPDLTFVASAEAIVLAGGIPVFVDIDPDTLTLSPDDLQKKFTWIQTHSSLQPKAVLCVDLFGNPCAYDSISAFCDRHCLSLIVDGAQAFGSSWMEDSTLNAGLVGTTSFFPAKNLGCCGDGGALFTNDAQIASCARSLALHGKSMNQAELYTQIGTNSRLDTLQAALLNVLLPHFESVEIDRLRTLAKRMRKAFQSAGLRVQKVLPQSDPVFSQFILLSGSQKERDELIRQLESKGIPARIYYPVPIHLQPAYAPFIKKAGFKPDGILNPNTVRVCQTIAALPFDAWMKDAEAEELIAAVLSITEQFLPEQRIERDGEEKTV